MLVLVLSLAFCQHSDLDRQLGLDPVFNEQRLTNKLLKQVRDNTTPPPPPAPDFTHEPGWTETVLPVLGYVACVMGVVAVFAWAIRYQPPKAD